MAFKSSSGDSPKFKNRIGSRNKTNEKSVSVKSEALVDSEKLVKQKI